jgi:peptide-methionine (R)-S-oxide reductase
MTRRTLLGSLAGAGIVAAGLKAIAGTGTGAGAGHATAAGGFPLVLSDAEWKTKLTKAQYDVLRGHGTERPWTSPLNDEKRPGIFTCAGCDHPLFDAAAKYESGTGWPSFYQPLPGGIGTSEDRGFFMVRTEVHCANCGGHLGHVFEDGPPPTGLRYCMNGVAMNFRPATA